jgi:hypothetical protein
MSNGLPSLWGTDLEDGVLCYEYNLFNPAHVYRPAHEDQLQVEALGRQGKDRRDDLRSAKTWWTAQHNLRKTRRGGPT